MAGTRRRVNVTVDFSTEAKNTLARLDDEITALQAMVSDLVGVHAHLAEMIRNEVDVAVERAAGANGGQVTILTPEPEPTPDPEPERPPLLESMTVPSGNPESKMAHDDPNRIRTSPFNRAPRSTQVAWLREVMADGEWYTAIGLATEYANDERHRRYLRAAFTHRLREMHEDGIAERTDSKERGAMFAYRLVPGE